MNNVLKQLDVFFNPPEYFKFNKDKHRYTYDGKTFKSVTTYIGKFSPRFNSEYWSNKKADERGVSVDVILKEWEAKKILGLTIGSIVHEWIEDFLNNTNPVLPKIEHDIDIFTAVEIEATIHLKIKNWLHLYQQRLHKLIPICQELKVWSLKYKLAGTIDGLFWYKEKLIVGDWKTNKKFTNDTDKIWNFLLWPFDQSADNTFNKYSLQVSLYRVILEEHGINTGPAFICWIPQEDIPAEFIIAKDYRKILKEYLSDTILL